MYTTREDSLNLQKKKVWISAKQKREMENERECYIISNCSSFIHLFTHTMKSACVCVCQKQRRSSYLIGHACKMPNYSYSQCYQLYTFVCVCVSFIGFRPLHYNAIHLILSPLNNVICGISFFVCFNRKQPFDSQLS